MARKANGKSSPPERAVETVANPPATNGGPQTSLLEAVTEQTVRDGLVRPAVSAAAAKQAWDEYTALCREILTERDYTYYAHWREKQQYNSSKAFETRALAEAHLQTQQRMRHDQCEIRERKKRSAWDKLAQYFSLTVPKADGPLCQVKIEQVGEYIIESRVGDSFSLIIYQEKERLRIVKAVATVVVSRPGLRTVIGEGVCSVNERKNGADSFAHADHDVPSTAFTRAFNRAVSRCIGTGEVSAEEFESEPNGNGQITAPAVPQAAVPSGETQKTTETPAAPDPAAAQPTKSGPANSATAKPKAEPKKAEVKPTAPPFVPVKSDSLKPRVAAMQEYLFGPVEPSMKRSAQVVKYLFFSAPTAVDAVIERTDGWLDADAWKGAMFNMSQEERERRMKHYEDLLATIGRERFLQWANEQVEKRFGKLAA